MRLRVLEGAFVNIKGGKGNNVEADLVQEHSVRNRKDLIRNLGANKSEKAMKRVTNAADAVSKMCHQVDKTLNVSTTSARHTKYTSEADSNKLKRVLRNVRPFNKTPGRECTGFQSVHAAPFSKINKGEMHTFLKRNIQRLGRGQAVETDVDEDENDVDLNDDNLDLPDIY